MVEQQEQCSLSTQTSTGKRQDDPWSSTQSIVDILIQPRTLQSLWIIPNMVCRPKKKKHGYHDCQGRTTWHNTTHHTLWPAHHHCQDRHATIVMTSMPPPLSITGNTTYHALRLARHHHSHDQHATIVNNPIWCITHYDRHPIIVMTSTSPLPKPTS